MLTVTVLLLGLTSALSQSIIPFSGMSFPLTVPFKGNPLVKDSTIIPISFITNPWTKGIKMDDEKLTVVKTVDWKPLIDDKVEIRKIITSEDLCLTRGIGCVTAKLGVSKEVDDSCLKTWGFNCLTLARMMPDEMCRKTGMACKKEFPIITPEEKCFKLRVGCTELCNLKGLGCELRDLSLPIITVN